VWWGAAVVVCVEQGADLHMAQLMPLPLTVSRFSKIQIGFTFLVPAHPGRPRKRAVKRVCVCVFVMCVQQCQHSCDELRSRRRRCAVGHGGPPGRLLDVAATTLRLPGPRRPVAAQGSQVLAQDDVPLDARVSDAGGRRRVADSNSRQHTVGIVDGCCHAGEETEKYVDALDILNSFICTGTADVSYDSCACYVLNFHFLKSLFLVFLFYALVLYCCTASLKITV